MSYVVNVLTNVLAAAVFVIAFRKTQGSLGKRGLAALGFLGAYSALGPLLISAILSEPALLNAAVAMSASYLSLIAFVSLAVLEFLEQKFLVKEKEEGS